MERAAAAPREINDLDALLVSVAERRDKMAFGQLFDHFAPRVKAYLMRLGADGGQAEELMQEALLTVWRRAESFDPRQAGAATWVFTIARNKRIDAIRRERRPELDPEDPALVPAETVSGDKIVEGEQREKALLAAIAELPQEQAELVRLAFYEDKTHSEIAAERGLPLGTVKSRLRLALGRLKKTLGPYDGDLSP